METCLLPLGAQTLAQVYQGWAHCRFMIVHVLAERAVCTVYSPRSGCVLGLMGSRVVIVALASGFSPAWAQPSTGSHRRGLRPARPRPAAET